MWTFLGVKSPFYFVSNATTFITKIAALGSLCATHKHSARPVRPRFPILAVGEVLARPRPPAHCSAPIQPPKPPKPRASFYTNLPELPKRARSAPKMITSERKNRQVPERVCLQMTYFRGGINLARAPYHPRPIGVGPHPHPNTQEKKHIHVGLDARALERRVA